MVKKTDQVRNGFILVYMTHRWTQWCLSEFKYTS